MKSTKWMWRTVAVCAVLATALCIFGFVYGVNQIMYPKASAGLLQQQPAEEAKKAEPLADKQQVRIVALGDSLTSGTGDLSGKGYVGQVRDKLEKQLGKPVFVYNNYAVPGYRTKDVLTAIDTKKDMSAALKEADLIMLTIGGNDLFEGGTGVFDQSSQGFNAQAAAERMPEALKRLETILDYVAKQNDQAPIFYIGLYHPFLDMDPAREGSAVVQKWNQAAFEIANKYPHMIMVPTYDLFELNLNKYLYSDHFHPNQDGYERIAERVAQILK
ncbi:GDSL-type esterase/lipase family protein [Paenibacillus thalictri]|uniref:Lipase n=1 Tax=Paenibacillus thalictri TaxID=2527873 RepID=A0A4Q9DGA9_9BACL|nr:GDSL-type esterase/lipase family protein [Paenibacillus thalictri]TBL68538.1 lipase [Paenibacillus thalictri]